MAEGGRAGPRKVRSQAKPRRGQLQPESTGALQGQRRFCPPAHVPGSFRTPTLVGSVKSRPFRLSAKQTKRAAHPRHPLQKKPRRGWVLHKGGKGPRGSPRSPWPPPQTRSGGNSRAGEAQRAPLTLRAVPKHRMDLGSWSGLLLLSSRGPWHRWPEGVVQKARI